MQTSGTRDISAVTAGCHAGCLPTDVQLPAIPGDPQIPHGTGREV